MGGLGRKCGHLHNFDRNVKTWPRCHAWGIFRSALRDLSEMASYKVTTRIMIRSIV